MPSSIRTRTLKGAHQTFCWLVLFNPFGGLFISSFTYVFYSVTHPHLYLSKRNLCSCMLKPILYIIMCLVNLVLVSQSTTIYIYSWVLTYTTEKGVPV